MKTNARANHGFTLVELAITMVILAILASLALPSYRQYILRGHRADATRALQDVASREESYFFSNSGYTASLTTLGTNSSVAGQYFTVTLASSSSSVYTATATAQGSQAKDALCTSFSIDQVGRKTVTGTGSPTDCWGTQ
ncbi:type IV pilin protein [Dyella telluris]|uniref:Prepilin-type N-terminal cleavage/methylation domain-containing protein n=1 Tax=Dyella telluris TaxID=2763498 RepID=A0A7G8Q133_9GAMM|nr:type IV pilin protein [Dyella telluris]QNK00491.1 prepilin-type N-terminal cleavage/methylation domain-containing protein [Dyella telluris]